jgi:hypothetical protein
MCEEQTLVAREPALGEDLEMQAQKKQDMIFLTWCWKDSEKSKDYTPSYNYHRPLVSRSSQTSLVVDRNGGSTPKVRNSGTTITQ